MVLVVALSCAADGDERIELGGLRRACALVRMVDADYRIDVRMTPVTAFDESTNGAMNRAIARSCALQALARHLSKKPSVYLAVSGARIVNSRGDARSFELTLLVPKDGVNVLDRRPAPDGEKQETILADPTLFNRGAEYAQTIFQLERALDGALDSLKATDRSKFESLARKVDTAYARLGKEIRADLELSDIGSDLDPDDKSEREQVLARLARSRQRLKARLERIRNDLSSQEKP
jgi:hypothetical protein